jgi:hypothetical protein
VAAALVGGCAPRTVTEQGQAIEHVSNVFFAVAVLVWGLVTGLMLWAIVHYRARTGRLPPQVHGQRAWHGAHLSPQDPERQMRRPQSILPGNGREASFQRELGRCPRSRMLAGVPWAWEVKAAATPRPRSAVLELPLQRVADRSMVEPPTEVRTCCVVTSARRRPPARCQ